MSLETAQQSTGNRYDLMEWAGAFGDLGTLIPFALAYITILKIDPAGLLFMFGLAKILSGLFYKTPIPIQPMKAIGVGSIAQAGAYAPAAVWGAGLFTGLVWLILGLTGLISRVTALAEKPVVQGIVLGLGFSFIVEGVRFMQSNYVLTAVALFLTFSLVGNRKFPVMFLLLALGAGFSILAEPSVLAGLKEGFSFHLPQFALFQLTWPDLLKGSLYLALPQVPLTLGNGIIAIVAENNKLFPLRPVTERQIACSTGIMNILAPLWGGVPMCHGAGGMAGHVRFGAKSGGALVILGTLVILIALFLSHGVNTIFQLFPPAILGVILFVAGVELASTAKPEGSRQDFYVTLITAGLAIWNMGIAFLAGFLLNTALKKGWIKPL